MQRRPLLPRQLLPSRLLRPRPAAPPLSSWLSASVGAADELPHAVQAMARAKKIERVTAAPNHILRNGKASEVSAPLKP